MSAGVFHTHFPCSECARALVIVSEFVYISHVFFLSRSLFCFLYKCDNHNLLLIFRQYIQRERKRTEVNVIVIVLLLSNPEVKKETTYKCVDENKYRFLFSGSIDAVVSISIEWNSHFAVIFTFLIFKWTREKERGRQRDRAKKENQTLTHTHSQQQQQTDNTRYS